MLKELNRRLQNFKAAGIGSFLHQLLSVYDQGCLPR